MPCRVERAQLTRKGTTQTNTKDVLFRKRFVRGTRMRTACRMADVCNGSSRMQWCLCQQVCRCAVDGRCTCRSQPSTRVWPCKRCGGGAGRPVQVRTWREGFVCVLFERACVCSCSRSHVAEGHDADQDAAKRERNGRVRHRIVRVDAALEVIDAIVAHVGWDCGELLLCCAFTQAHNTQHTPVRCECTPHNEGIRGAACSARAAGPGRWQVGCPPFVARGLQRFGKGTPASRESESGAAYTEALQANRPKVTHQDTLYTKLVMTIGNMVKPVQNDDGHGPAVLYETSEHYGRKRMSTRAHRATLPDQSARDRARQ